MLLLQLIPQPPRLQTATVLPKPIPPPLTIITKLKMSWDPDNNMTKVAALRTHTFPTFFKQSISDV
jgi:hypothetical protein